ncbi:MAG: nuclease-related domain-containing protein, partial [Succinimonas sp.]|nr:nuclease-related domain-containing protein [Succinimonas sp.]
MFNTSILIVIAAVAALVAAALIWRYLSSKNRRGRDNRQRPDKESGSGSRLKRPGRRLLSFLLRRRRKDAVSGTVHNTHAPQKLPDARKFEEWKMRISSGVDEKMLLDYMEFLRLYPGSRVRHRGRKKVIYSYTGKELGTLKGMFLNVIVPTPRLYTTSKEQFREFLINLGVSGLTERPNYEERSGKLRVDRHLSETDRRIKTAGNIGEKAVRDVLEKLPPEYKSVSGIYLEIEGSLRLELDHVVIGPSGMFILETKAFGITPEGVNNRLVLFINKDGEWSKTEHGRRVPLNSPEEQITRQQQIMQDFFRPINITPRVILVLANR